MATSAKMSFNFYQNGKYGTLPQNPTKEMEVTQDMHLKMSKKIAQLTKVIYALNTKNDEHEAVVAALKDQHEEEMQQLLSETKKKIEVYRNKICNEAEYRQRIDSLEVCISKYERQKEESLSQFSDFKQQAEQRETRLKTEHAEKMLSLSQEVLGVKKNFEEQLQKLSEFQFGVDSKHQESLQELSKRHEQEIQNLKQIYESKSGDFTSERLRLEEVHKLNILKLEEQCDLISTEKSKLIEDYEGKLSKLQAFYDSELAALKSTHSANFQSELDMLREEQLKLQKDFAFQEAQYKHRIDGLIEQVSTGEDEINSYKQQLEQLTASISGKEDGMGQLSKQLEAAKDEAAKAVTRLREQEAELVASKHMVSQQAQDLLNKSSVIGELEATRLQQQSTICDLQSELNKLRDRLSWLERERQDLETHSQSQAKSSDTKLRSLEQALEDISVEKQTLKERYDREIRSLQEQIIEKEKSLTAQHSQHISQLAQQHQDQLTKEREAANQKLTETTSTLEKKLQEETSRLTSEKNTVVTEFEQVKAELLSKLQTAEQEVLRLESAVKDTESGLGSASVHINNLKDASTRLKQELDNSHRELKQAKTTTASLKAELEKLKMTYEARLTAADHELQTRTQQLTTDLEKKWTDTLKQETSDLRANLVRQKEDEMAAALQQLTRLRDEELGSVRADKDAQIDLLNKQLAELKYKLDHSETAASENIEKLRSDLEAERLQLEAQVAEVKAEYNTKLETSDKEHTEQLNNLQAQLQQQLNDLETRLKTEHIAEMTGQLTAHRAAVDQAQLDAEQKRVTELGEVKARHKHDMDTLRTQLLDSHGAELEQLSAVHQGQIQAARIELDRAMEISRQKERDHKTKTEELQGEISQREKHVRNLDEETHKLRRQLEYLSRDLEQQSREMSKLRADADVSLQKQAEIMRADQEAVLNNLAADHLRETQDMLMEFNRAQELLKDKISQLNVLLDESEERYRQRDSRPEDLELIHQLREAVSEREIRMKQLIDEKRYYQMELVNRETNFNKVFNSTPNVGVLNPLAKPKKKGGEKGIGKFTSAPSLNAWGSANRLDPLPNSPLHDEKLNPSRPLPQPHFAKKFVK